MNNDPLNIGIIGAGKNTQDRHIPGFREIADVTVSAVANRTLESAEQAAQALNIPTAYENWQEIVDDPDIDAICIGTWPYLHEAITLAALDVGKHVLSEARMAGNLDEALSMHSALQQNPELVGQIVPAPMTLRADTQIIDIIASGELGTIIGVDVTAGALDSGSPGGPLSWRQDTHYSGRNTMTLGIWYEALMRWVGPAKNVNALSRVTVPWRRDHTGEAKAITLPDHLELIADMTCGATLHMRISAATHFDRSEVNIFGTKGTLRWCEGKLYYGKSDTQTIQEIDLSGRDWNVEADFIESIRTGAPVRLTSFNDGVRYMAFTEAVLASAAKRDTVPVEVY